MAQKKSSGRRRKTTATVPRSRKKSGAAVQRKREAEHLLFLRGEVLPLFLALFAVLLLLSNFGLCGALGTVLRDVQLGLFGGLGLLFPFLLCGIVIYRALTEDKSRALGKTVALPLTYLLVIALVHLAGRRGRKLCVSLCGEARRRCARRTPFGGSRRFTGTDWGGAHFTGGFDTLPLLYHRKILCLHDAARER